MHNSVTRSVTDVLEEPADLDNDEPTYSVTPLQDYDHYTQDIWRDYITPYERLRHIISDNIHNLQEQPKLGSSFVKGGDDVTLHLTNYMYV